VLKCPTHYGSADSHLASRRAGESFMSDSLLTVVLTLIVAVGTAGVLLLLSWLLGRPKKSVVDLTPYESGSRLFERIASHRFSVKFYLVAMLFILFDIEVAFLYPWAVTLGDFGPMKWFVLGQMVVFLGILEAAFLYVWWRGGLNWE
jgi:NADH-quinone oxidoreductase subunit A